jgi:hypothetical protein
MNGEVLHYEDLEPGSGLSSPAHRVDRDELIAFAREWDPLPFHVDEAGRGRLRCQIAGKPASNLSSVTG